MLQICVVELEHIWGDIKAYLLAFTYCQMDALETFQFLYSCLLYTSGESKEVSFDITPDMLKFYNADLKHVIEPGDFQIILKSATYRV